MPILSFSEMELRKLRNYRKAGLGLLGNMIGDKKAVACIEDTAVALDDLAPYITEFSSLRTPMDKKLFTTLMLELVNYI